MEILSIVTTVYNRAKLLPFLYKSLCNQTCLDFQWIIVDDGSTDNIDEIVHGFDNKFSIFYFKQQNAGKCSALNYAIEQCDTELFFVVDSDDFLKENAVEMVIKTWCSIQEKEHVIGIVAYREFTNGYLSGKKFPTDKEYILMNELNYKYRHHGETALIYLTDLLKKHMFPKYEKENFLSEEVVYNELDQEGHLYVLRERLIVMEYLENGLTSNYFRNWIKNPKGTQKLMESKYYHTLGLSLKDIVIKRVKVSIQFDVLCMCSTDFCLMKAPNKFLSVLVYPLAALIKFQLSQKKLLKKSE